MMKHFFAASLLVLIAFTANASAQQSHLRVTGIYSDLHLSSGDLLGIELLIIPAKSGYQAFVQIAEGDVPYAAVVPVIVEGAGFDFTLPVGSMYSGQHFEGSFTPWGLVLKWGHGQTEVLRRRRSYWQ